MSETILKLLAEGGSITVLGQRNDNGFSQFLIQKNEVVLYDCATEAFDGEPNTRSGLLNSWEDVVRVFDQNPHWVRLHPKTIHADFAEQIFAWVEQRAGASADTGIVDLRHYLN